MRIRVSVRGKTGKSTIAVFVVNGVTASCRKVRNNPIMANSAKVRDLASSALRPYVGVLLAGSLLLLIGAYPPNVALARINKPRHVPGPCYSAFPSAHSKTRGQSTFYNRQRSVQLVVCDGFGQSADSAAHMTVTVGMACALLTQAIPKKYHDVALFVDGSCSGAQLAAHHDLETDIGVACGFTADLLGVTLKAAGRLAGLACALAPAAGHFLASWAESRHERSIAQAVIHRGRCIRFNRHIVTRWAAVKCAHDDPGFRLLPRATMHARPAPAPPAPPAPSSTWLSLPGTALATGNAALLLAEDGNGFTGGGYLWAIGTSSGELVRISLPEGLPPGTTPEVSGSMVTEPSAGHPLGLAVVLLDVTFPEEGINPRHDEGYYSVFDIATGQHISTSAPFDAELAHGGGLVGYFGGNIRLIDEDFVTIDAAGDVTHAPLPAAGAFPVGPPVAGHVLLEDYDQPNDVCPTAYVVDVATGTLLSKTPCIGRIDGQNYANVYFDGSVVGVPSANAFFASGPLTAPGQLGSNEGDTEFIGAGARSDLTVVQNAGYSYFISTSTWQTVFTATPNQPFTVLGVADDDVWVDTSHWEGDEYVGGRIVIDGHTGAQIAAGWSVFPIAGGAGWTLASTDEGDCLCASDYLLRSAGPLVASLAPVPAG